MTKDIAVIAPEVEQYYLSHGFLAADIQMAEDAAIFVRQSQRNAVSAIIQIGIALNGVKAEIPHGDFGDWVTTRAGISQETANRMMAAARLVEQNPRLNEYLASFQPTALYTLGQYKTPPAGLIDAVIGYAEAGEVSAQNVRDIITDIKEASGDEKPSKAAKLPFTPIDPNIAARVRDKAADHVQALLSVTAVGLDIGKIVKSPKYRAFCKGYISADSPLAVAAQHLLAVAFVIEESIASDAGSTTASDVVTDADL